MPSGPDDERPMHVKLVRGRWFWDPPDRIRASHGIKTKPLGADQTKAWAYARMLNRDHLGLGPDVPTVGSIAWLLDAFLGTPYFDQKDVTGSLASATQRDYRWLANKVLRPLAVGRSTLGQMPAAGVKPRHADGIYEELLNSKGAATAHYACRFARRVWKWAARKEMVGPLNPWAGMELKGLPARTAVWTREQVAAVVAKADEKGRPSLGLATLIGYWFGHREEDILALTWQALAEFEVDTQKTKVALPVSAAAYPALQAALEFTRAAQRQKAAASEPEALPPSHVVIHERTGRRYTTYTFNHRWREVATAAGIGPELQFRDLRATALTELSDSGADIISMSTHSGHKTAQMARRYARPTSDQFERAAKGRVEHLDRQEAAAKAKRPGNK